MANSYQSVNKDRRVWTHYVVSARADDSAEYIVILARKSEQGQSATVSVRVCPAVGSPMGKTVYWEPCPLKEYSVKKPLEAIDAKLKAELGISIGQPVPGLAKKGMRLYSWTALANVSYETKPSDSSRRRAIFHLAQSFTKYELVFKGPWRAGDEDSVRAAAFADWNQKMRGFAHINWSYDESDFAAELGGFSGSDGELTG